MWGTNCRPEIGDYHALPQEGEGRALLRTPQRRRADLQRLPAPAGGDAARARLGRNGPASGGNIVCPLHRWTYSAGQRARPARCWARRTSRRSLPEPEQLPGADWNGLVFEANGYDVRARWPGWAPGGPGLLRLRATTARNCTRWTTTGRPSSRSTWRTTTSARSIPGLGNFVTCDDLRWEFGREYSVQTVGVAGKLGKAGSDVYRKWHDECCASRTAARPSRAPCGSRSTRT
jgi:choline monooxygenase